MITSSNNTTKIISLPFQTKSTELERVREGYSRNKQKRETFSLKRKKREIARKT